LHTINSQEKQVTGVCSRLLKALAHTIQSIVIQGL
jgi:hypothetical protein